MMNQGHKPMTKQFGEKRVEEYDEALNEIFKIF